MPIFYRDVETKRQVISGFQCSKCESEYRSDDILEMQEMIHLRGTGGHRSVWGDGTTYEITLCQKCCHDLLKDYATIYDA